MTQKTEIPNAIVVYELTICSASTLWRMCLNGNDMVLNIYVNVY